MFKRILYPTDFSPCAEAVLPYLLKMKDAGTREVILCHVIDERVGAMFIPAGPDEVIPSFGPDFFKSMEEECSRKLDTLAGKLKRKFKVKVVLEKGIPFRTILDVAEREDVSLVMLGSHGKSNIAEMLLGSVSEKVVRKAKRPCLVIKRSNAAGC